MTDVQSWVTYFTTLVRYAIVVAILLFVLLFVLMLASFLYDLWRDRH